jgi:hypothetical protein
MFLVNIPVTVHHKLLFFPWSQAASMKELILHSSANAAGAQLQHDILYDA